MCSDALYHRVNPCVIDYDTRLDYDSYDRFVPFTAVCYRQPGDTTNPLDVEPNYCDGRYRLLIYHCQEYTIVSEKSPLA